MNIKTTETDTSGPWTGAAAATWARDHVLLDDFVVEATLGTGGMGEVHRLRHLLTGSCYAVKRARIAGEEPQRRLLQELQVWFDLPPHPNLHPLLFVRSVEEELVLFTPVADGGDLAQWLQSGRLGALPDVLRVAVQLASGLAAAHAARIVHQDIKPTNVLMTADGDAMISDFGIARMCQAFGDATRTPQTVYAGRTLAYCSPEQHAKQSVSSASDVWSFGLVVLELLLGRRIWLNGAKADTALGSLDPRTPKELVQLLQRCLARDPAHRWQHGRALLHALTEACNSLGLATLTEPRRKPGTRIGALLEQSLQREHPPHLGETTRALPLPAIAASFTHEHLQQAHAFLGLPELSDGMTLLGVSRRACLAAMLHRYDRAALLLSRHPEEQTAGDRRRVHAALLEEKAEIHLELDDVPGARRALVHSVALWEVLVRTNEGPNAAEPWLKACTLHVGFLVRTGHAAEALEEIERVARLAHSLPHATAGTQLQAFDLLRLKASAHQALGQLERALVAFQSAALSSQQLLAKLDDERSIPSKLRPMAAAIRAAAWRSHEVTLMNMAGVLDDLHRGDESVRLQSDVLTSRQRRAAAEPSVDHLRDVAFSCFNLAISHQRRGERPAARHMILAAASAYSQILGNDPNVHMGSLHLSRDVWLEYCNILTCQGSIFADDGDYPQALASFDNVVPIFEQIVLAEGHFDHVGQLAQIYEAHAEVLASAGRPGDSQAMFERSATMLRRLLASQPAHASERLALLLKKRRLRLGTSAAGHEEAIALLEAQVKTHDRPQLVGELAQAYLRRYDDEGQGTSRGEAWIERTLALLDGGRPDEVPAHHLEILFEALARKGTLLGLRDDDAAAVSQYDRALDLFVKRRLPAAMAVGVVQCNRAHCLGRQGEWIDCALGYMAAVDVLEPIYRESPDAKRLEYLLTALATAAFAWLQKKVRRRAREIAARAIEVHDEAPEAARAALSAHTCEMIARLRQKLPELPTRATQYVDPMQMIMSAAPGQPVHEAVKALLLCFSWSEKQRLVRLHWSAFMQEGLMIAFLMFGQRLTTMDPETAEKFREMLKLNLELVKACKRYGIDATFAAVEVRQPFVAAGLLPADASG